MDSVHYLGNRHYEHPVRNERSRDQLCCPLRDYHSTVLSPVGQDPALDWKKEMAMVVDPFILHRLPIDVYPGALVGRDIPDPSATKADKAPVWNDLAQLFAEWL